MFYDNLDKIKVPDIPSDLYRFVIEWLRTNWGTVTMHTSPTIPQAYVQLVRLEQEKAEKERQREEGERKKRREQALRVKRMLEAAFDGDTQEINALLKEVDYVIELARLLTMHLCQKMKWKFME